MKIKNLFLMALALFSNSSWAGFTVNNGGDTVECFASRVSPFVGYYNLDYLINLIYGNKYVSQFDQTVKPSDSYDIQFNKIIALTAVRYPLFSRSLASYRNQFFINDFNAPYSWKTAPYGLVEVNDESLKLIVPGNCLRTSPTGPFIQTIVRSQKPEQVEFTFYTSVFDGLTSVQKSFLLFHEWLWNFTDDPEVIRNANSVLHSYDWNEKTLSYKITELLLAGLDFSKLGVQIRNFEFNIYLDRVMSPNLASSDRTLEGVPLYETDECQVNTICRYRFNNNTDQKLYGIQSQDTQNLTDFIVSPQSKGSLVYESYKPNLRQFFCLYFNQAGGLTPTQCDVRQIKDMKLKPSFILRLK